MLLRGRATQVETEHWTRRNTRSQSWLWIPRRRIGKGPGQPQQLACTGRLRGSSTQVAWSRDRALEAREHARRAVDPSETHWQGPRIAAAASLHRAAAGQRDSGRLESGQSTRGEGTHARRAVDPAETHYQGPRTAAAASLHRAAAGQGDSSQDRAQEAREHARRAVDPAETHWQGPKTAAAASLHRAAAGQRRLRSPGVGTEH